MNIHLEKNIHTIGMMQLLAGLPSTEHSRIEKDSQTAVTQNNHRSKSV